MSDRLTTEIHMRDDAREGVVLLHGLARTQRSMRAIARACQAAGFATLNIDYSSRKGTIEDHAMAIAQAVIAFATRFERVHLVGFSLGALVIRAFLTHYRPSNLGRVVMIGPPFGGSQVADALIKHRRIGPFAIKWYGPVLTEMTTARCGTSRVYDIDYPLGVIAGVTPWAFVWRRTFGPRLHDGRVALDATRMPGLSAHIVLPLSHSRLVTTRQSIRAVVSFLRCGTL